MNLVSLIALKLFTIADHLKPELRFPHTTAGCLFLETYIRQQWVQFTSSQIASFGRKNTRQGGERIKAAKRKIQIVPNKVPSQNISGLSTDMYCIAECKDTEVELYVNG